MFKSILSFYGGKSRIAHLYPKPVHDCIIEPFAGGAGYSLCHWERDVLLNELDDLVYRIWAWLIAGAPGREAIPAAVDAGVKVTDLVGPDADPGMIGFLQAEANQGTQGARGVHNQVTSMGAKCWPRIHRKLDYWLPKIAHWSLSNVDYRELPMTFYPATWFIDPPYMNLAGQRYRQGPAGIDYAHLANWCRSRHGQVIVCENAGATWLDFVPLVARQGIKSRYQQSKAMEVIWTT